VLDLPDGDEEIVFHTHTQASKALSALKTWLGSQESQDLNTNHLQNIMKTDLELKSGIIDDDMAIRFFLSLLATNCCSQALIATSGARMFT
jgi:hypothetical protein